VLDEAEQDSRKSLTVDGRLSRWPFVRHSDLVRPTVKPGAAVLRRDIDHLQVGTSPGVIVHDRPGLYPFLRALDGTRDIAALRRHAALDHPELDDDVEEVLAPLIAAGAVIDLPDIASPRLGLAVAHDGPSTAFAHLVGSLAAAVNIDISPEPDLTITISSGEPSRPPLIDAACTGAAHLVVVIAGEDVRIGPFVVPGRTPCIGCLDLYRSGWDPVWPVLVPQFGVYQRHALNVLTEHAAASEVTAECLQFAHGEMPRTASEVIVVDPDRTVRTLSPSHFHPRCTCALLSAA
jgi:hypothetical protein